MTDKVQRAKIISTMFAAYGQGSEAERMAIYIQMLKDIPVEILDKACNKAVMESKFLPTIADILESAREIVAEFTGTGVLPFAEAWKEIEHQMQTAFIYVVPKFSRPEIEKTVNAFGWHELCEVSIKDLPIVRAQLRDMYNAICQQGVERQNNYYVLGKGELIINTTKLLGK